MLRARPGRRWHTQRRTAALDPGRLVRLVKPGRQPHLRAARVGARRPHPAALVVGGPGRVAPARRLRALEWRARSEPTGHGVEAVAITGDETDRPSGVPPESAKHGV